MKLIEDILLDTSTSMKKALQVIDTGEMKIALVVDGDKRLIGTVSDGDIRRAILNGVALSEPVEDIMNCNFIYAKVGDSKEKILQLAKYNKIYQVPIVDENFILVGIEEVSDF